MKFITYRSLLIITLIFSVVSCVPLKNINYFNDINELEGPLVNPRTQKVIMPFDRVYVRVLSIDPQTSLIFNSGDEMRMGGTSSPGLIGYLVDENGNINFPFVGDINILNLTTTQASEKIQDALSDYVANISVVVKLIDNQVTVIGEVNRQGIFNFIQDKLNIYEALALGGGITRYGDRKKVILIRNEEGKIVHYRLNLQDSKIAGKNYFYILPNDVIVVEPLRAISTSYANVTYSTALSTIATLITILLFLGVN